MSNELGKRIVANYMASNNKKPGGDCFAAAYKRVSQASQQVCQTSLPPLDAFKPFDRLWGLKIDPKNTWLALPETYRGKGSAGAMAHLGRGTLDDKTNIWTGGLLPGALVQTWELESDFVRVRDGNLATKIGHSFIFLEYVKNGSSIIGMKIADQGSGWDEGILAADIFEYWIGANITC